MIQSIYIAGKLSGDIEAGKKLMIEYAAKLVERGYIVYVPYWTFDIDAIVHLPHDWWVNVFDNYWLDKCDAIFMLPNWKESKGATLEHGEAIRKHKHIFYDLKDVPLGR